MTNQDFGRSNDATTPSRDGKARNIKGAASDAFAKVSDVARRALAEYLERHRRAS